MTSNIGSSYLLENKCEDGIDPQIREEVMNEMKMRFKPEFLNRFNDYFIIFAINYNMRAIINISSNYHSC